MININEVLPNSAFLEDLGFTKTEIAVYVALLSCGSTSVGKILETSGLPNSTVHRDLNALIQRGLINFVLEGKRKVYQATDPVYFYNLLEEKKKQFDTLYPKLQELQQHDSQKEAATVYKGIKGIKEVYSFMVSLTKEDIFDCSTPLEYNTFGGGFITVEIMGFTWWQNLHVRRVANNLPSRQVFDKTVKEGGDVLAQNPLTQIRYIDEKFAQFQETVIVGDCVAIAVFSKNPYAFLIKDSFVAKSYRKHFELLWNSAGV